MPDVLVDNPICANDPCLKEPISGFAGRQLPVFQENVAG